jgi:hypothetical protein
VGEISALNPMFEKTKIIKMEEQQKRKPRNDKKKQIKIPVTEKQKLDIARMSLENGHKGEIDSYLADVFAQAVERPYLKYSKPVEYEDVRNYVSTKVTEAVYKEVVKLKVEWGLRSIRQASHRILINELMG